MAQGSDFSDVGLIVGRFLPPHLGHDFAVNFSRRFVERLRVYLLSHVKDGISAPRRLYWLREMFPDVEITCLEVPGEIDPEGPECRRWLVEKLKGINGFKSCCFFSSEQEDREAATALGGRWVAIDPPRQVFPISSREIRLAPLEHWKFLPKCVRPQYVKRVCLYGPESTGKSILAQRLAGHYNTLHVPEYARTFAESKGNGISFEETAQIARGHAAAEDALARHANRILFCDTDTITTTLWCETLYDRCFPWIREWADRRSYDLHLLLDTDVPWIDDPVRCQPDEKDRRLFFERCLKELKRRDRPYLIIKGDWEARFSAACEAVDALIRSQ